MEEKDPSISENTLLEAKMVLEKGSVIALPTDTVYGLGISPLHAHTLDALYNLKHREAAKPIAWLLADPEDILVYGCQIPSYALDLAKRYWPGALTLIVNASDRVPRVFQSETGTIGLRVPDHTVTRQLIRLLGSPLAVTSANISGQVAASTLATINPQLRAGVAFVLPDTTTTPSGRASTVVDCTQPQPRILRQGDVYL